MPRDGRRRRWLVPRNRHAGRACGGRRRRRPAAPGDPGRRDRDPRRDRGRPGAARSGDADEFIEFFSNLGLGMLFFFAGYEIDFERIRGAPLRLALLGWAVSLALAYTIGGILAAAGIVLSLLYTGSAMATTAIGTLIPILSDAGELRTRFGTKLLAAGAMGEFGPILLITLVFSTRGTISNAAHPARLRGDRRGDGDRRHERGAPRLGAHRANARVERTARDPHCRGARSSRSSRSPPSSASTCCSAASSPG